MVSTNICPVSAPQQKLVLRIHLAQTADVDHNLEMRLATPREGLVDAAQTRAGVVRMMHIVLFAKAVNGAARIIPRFAENGGPEAVKLTRPRGYRKAMFRSLYRKRSQTHAISSVS